MTEIKLKRIYDEKEASDGFRVLADRLWPRGISKESASIDLWEKAITPSNDLRKWYHAHSDKFEEFFQKYTMELAEIPETEVFIKLILSKQKVSLLTAAKDVSRSHLAVLRIYLEKKNV